MEAYKQTVTSKRTNSVILDKLTRALLQEMDIHDDDYLPRSSLSLYSKAGVAKCAYARNIGSFYGVILRIKNQIVIDIDQNVIGRFGARNYDDVLRRLFIFFAQSPEVEESDVHVRLRFALRKFNNEFWETALHGLYPLITKEIDEYPPCTKEEVFSRFIANLRIVLIWWSKSDFSEQRIDICIEHFGSLVGLETRRLEQLNKTLIPLLCS